MCAAESITVPLALELRPRTTALAAIMAAAVIAAEIDTVAWSLSAAKASDARSELRTTLTNTDPEGQEIVMNERIKLRLISRRQAFWLLTSAAALSVVAPVITAMDAEARVGNPGSPVSIAGANRRDRRQDRRYKKSPAATGEKKTPTTTGENK
jgi:hypothetical protein